MARISQTNSFTFVARRMALMAFMLFLSTAVHSKCAYAQSTWIVNGGGEYDFGPNWSPTGAPGPGTDVMVATPDGTSTAAITAFDDGGLVDIHNANNLTILSNGANPAHRITVGSNSRLDVSGDITNDGLIILDARLLAGNAAPSANLRFGSSDVDITGNGRILMATIDIFPNIVEGSGQLTQGAGHTIEGDGFVGGLNSQLSVVNHGLFDANISGGTLTIDPRNTTDPLDITFDNTGVVQASAGGVIELQAGNYSGSGVYQALAGSSLWMNGATIRNTTLSTVGDGTILAFANSTLVNVTNNADLQISNNHDLNLMGTLTNNATLTTNTGVGGRAEIVVHGAATLNGGGTITLKESDRIRRSTGDATLNNVDNTIQGVGSLGGTNSLLSVNNQGLIDANVAGETLVLDPKNGDGSGALTFDNQGTAQASNGGILRMQAGEFGGSGNYRALAGSSVWLDGATVRDTTLATSGDGTILAFANSTLIQATNNADLRISNNHDLNLVDAFTNNATLSTNTVPGGRAEIILHGEVTIDGGGTISLKANDRFRRSSGDVTLINVNNTIEGAGSLGGTNSLLTVVNHGMIDANVAGETLFLDPKNGDGSGTLTFDNQGTAQASNGATLQLSAGEYGGSGTYWAQSDSLVWLNSATVRDSTFATAGNGVVGITNTIARRITNNGTMGVYGTRDFDVHESLTNTGSIRVGLTTGSAELVVVSDTQLTGGGSVILSDTDDRIRSENGSTLTNVDNTIQGRGDINSDIVNNGSIVGDSAADFIEINNRLSGHGSLENVRIDQVHAPGLSTAIVSLSGQYTIASTGELQMEIGGSAPGTGYDQLDSTGTVNLDGDLTLAVIDNFAPQFGDLFTIVRADTLNGSFDNAANGTRLDTNDGLGSFVVSQDGLTNEVVVSEFIFAADFNMDQVLDIVDIDNLVAEIVSGGNGTSFDLTGDGFVDVDDLSQWLADAGRANLASGNSYLIGDANLDGAVDGQDFLAWNENKFDTAIAWSAGDFTADGFVDGQDFLAWNDNKFQTADARVAIPEPTTSWLLFTSILAFCMRNKME